MTLIKLGLFFSRVHIVVIIIFFQEERKKILVPDPRRVYASPPMHRPTDPTKEKKRPAYRL